MRTTIGSANLRIDENGDIILTDQFNFNDAKDVKSLERLLIHEFFWASL